MEVVVAPAIGFGWIISMTERQSEQLLSYVATYQDLNSRRCYVSDPDASTMTSESSTDLPGLRYNKPEGKGQQSKSKSS